MTFSQWLTEQALARLNDRISKIYSSDYESGLRERWPLLYGQTAQERETFIFNALAESWNWRF
jgi:hypothetical protein